MNAAWWFIAGWLSAAVVVAIALLHRRSSEWLDAENSVQFAIGCEEFARTHQRFQETRPLQAGAQDLVADRILSAVDNEPARGQR